MKKNNKGFTLAELLVVVAIIGVLVAIAIPIFTGQMEKSRDSVTVANLRSAYAEAQTVKATAESSGNAVYNDKDGTVTVKNVAVKGKKKEWEGKINEELPFGDKIATEGSLQGEYGAGNVDVTFTYDKDGKIDSVSCTTLKPETKPGT